MKLEDIPQVAQLHLEVAQHVKNVSDDPYFNFESSETNVVEEKLKEGFNDPAGRIYVAREGKEVIAFISGHIMPCYLPISLVKKVGYISAAYTSPQYRGQNVMRILDDLMNQFFKENGVEYVELHVMLGNQMAMDAWEKLGYQNFRVHMRRKI